MMDPLSITAGVIAIVQISTGIVSICSDYVRDVKDAPSDLRKVMLEVAAVKGIFEALSLLLGITDDGQPSPSLQSDNEKTYSFLRDAIAGCEREVAALGALFPKAEGRSCDGTRRKPLLSLTILAWPLKASRAKKHLDDIARYKSTISLALTTRSCLDIRNVSSKIERIQDTLSNKERQDILQWLVTTDPSSNHNNACNLHEPHTGNWLTRSPEYLNWKNGSTRFLWLHGIPGAGKTILASFIFEDIKFFCKDSALEGTGWAYYYCYYGHKHDETPHLLRWIINQLCRQMDAVPDEVRQLFQDGGSSPVRELKLALGAVLRSFHRVYLVIDALDESLERERILNLLVSVLDDHVFQKLQLLAMSRNEVDIERALVRVSVNISLSNPHVDEDIRVYIQNALCHNHKFSRWPEELRQEIETALVKGAKGMFRWAFCQLDILKRLNTIPEIRKALGELPGTLDETYERILCSIAVEHQNIAYRTLQLLTFDFAIKSLGALLDALAVDVERCTFTRDNRVLDTDALLEVCTCLITMTPGKEGTNDKNSCEVELAHYTVKEYLVSDRIGRGSAGIFQISNESAYLFVAKCFITYMLDENYDASLKQWAEAPYRSARLMGLAMSKWAMAVRKIESSAAQAAVIPLVLRLLDSTGPHFQSWVKIGIEISGSEQDGMEEWITMPGCDSCMTLVYLCYFGLFEAAKKFVESLPEPVPFETEIKLANLGVLWEEYGTECAGDIEDGKLLHIAALTGKILFVRYFISKGADVNAISAKALSVLGSALCSGLLVKSRDNKCVLEIVETLLESGADPNISRVSCTPLQRVMSVWAHSSDIAVLLAKMLLDFGADINGIGDDECNIARLLVSAEDSGLQNHEAGFSRTDLKYIITRRFRGENYDSPLRLVENLIISGPGHVMPEFTRSCRRKRLRSMQVFLIKRGAKSFHQDPTGDLSVHVQSRVEEYHKSVGYDPSSVEEAEAERFAD